MSKHYLTFAIYNPLLRTIPEGSRDRDNTRGNYQCFFTPIRYPDEEDEHHHHHTYKPSEMKDVSVYE